MQALSLRKDVGWRQGKATARILGMTKDYFSSFFHTLWSGEERVLPDKTREHKRQ